MEDLGSRDPSLSIAARAGRPAFSLPPLARVGDGFGVARLRGGAMIGPGTVGQSPSRPAHRTVLPSGGGPAGAKEKDLTLAVARRLKTAVETRLGVRVLLTRDDDRNVPIDERAATANHNKADIFLSLHANASLRPGTTGGTIFYAAF